MLDWRCFFIFDEAKHVFCGEDYVINDFITVKNPTVYKILREFGEERYFKTLQLFTIRPYDAQVFLFDLGVDYEDVDEFMFFAQNIMTVDQSETEIFTGDLDFKSFVFVENPENGQLGIYNKEKDILIDRAIYYELVNYIRKINFIDPKPEFNPGNKITKKFLVDRMRRKIKKNQKKKFKSQIVNLLSSAVNSNGFKYDYETVQSLHISQFFDAFYRLGKIMNYNQIMGGVYAGTINYNEMGPTKQEELYWSSDIIK